jgi:hypothetical protein
MQARPFRSAVRFRVCCAIGRNNGFTTEGNLFAPFEFELPGMRCRHRKKCQLSLISSLN